MKKFRFNPQRASFVASSPDWRSLPVENVPVVVIAGRSNVGKSSFINMLLHRKNIARTSSTPGRTQLLNFFDVDGKLALADVPGYGFASAPKAVVENWVRNLTGFVTKGEGVALVIQLLDIRHKPTQEDRWFADLVRGAGRRILPVTTKADKIARTKRPARVKEIAQAIGVDAGQVLLTSAREGLGRDEVWHILDRELFGPPPAPQAAPEEEA